MVALKRAAMMARVVMVAVLPCSCERDPRGEAVATSCGMGWTRHIKGADHACPLIQGPNRTQKQAPNFPYLSSS